MARPSRPPAAISAHRCGGDGDSTLENTAEGLDAALGLGVEFVEFDVQRCGDGTLVVCHDPVTGTGAGLPRYSDVLAALAGRAKAHIDLKLSSPAEAYAAPETTAEVAAVIEAVEVLGPDRLIVTSLDDRSVRAVRDWAEAQGHDGLLVGLSLGGDLRHLSPVRRFAARASELVPHGRFRRSRANLVVAHHRLARAGVAGFARRRGLPLLVWTVDTDRALRHWTRPGRAWLVTTNRPGVALRVRPALQDSWP